MMIAHVSVPADDCEKVARVLAEIMEGRALPFPPGGPQAWMAWSGDEKVEIEVTPRGAYMVRGPQEVTWEERPRERAAETHLALCVEREAGTVVDVAARAGWPARICDRGGFFHVVEVWVEGAYLIEVLDPAYTEEYRRSMSVENWMRTFGMAA
ncbi:MAG: hypothetical protein VX640_07155 [Pseudomonadota bacterium]|nr:hypothetical protein [Pseudomonadota bacterium]